METGGAHAHCSDRSRDRAKSVARARTELDRDDRHHQTDNHGAGVEHDNRQPKSNIPPAARSGEKGIRAGEGAMDAGPVEVKRLK